MTDMSDMTNMLCKLKHTTASTAIITTLTHDVSLQAVVLYLFNNAPHGSSQGRPAAAVRLGIVHAAARAALTL